MRSRTKLRGRACAGLTIMELVIATSIFGVIGYALIGAVAMGRNSQQAVLQVVSSNEDIREANGTLTDEMKIGGDSTVVVTTLPDGNHELTFMQPVEVGGTLGWGVFDRTYGPNPDDQNKENWQIRYTVESIPLGGGETNRRLLRQILDDSNVVQEEDVVIEGLRSGAPAPPGFSATKMGDMWVVNVHTVGSNQNSQGQGTEFHVKMRN